MGSLAQRKQLPWWPRKAGPWFLVPLVCIQSFYQPVISGVWLGLLFDHLGPEHFCDVICFSIYVLHWSSSHCLLSFILVPFTGLSRMISSVVSWLGISNRTIRKDGIKRARHKIVPVVPFYHPWFFVLVEICSLCEPNHPIPRNCSLVREKHANKRIARYCQI